ncbi:hypothetical protein T07_7773 [Trichinella nelsoni]|uniref:Uncharacterized protein n=1 Tax=Trichinella nelsoni TaxID=6336 RepID=A0A0V0RV18_9BILA|nr:hypothetical protein T07_7773 [Trichinella nelsoni]
MFACAGSRTLAKFNFAQCYVPGVELFKGKSNEQLIGMNIESAVCSKYAPVTSAETDDVA